MRTSAYATILFLTLALAFIAMRGSNAQSSGNAQASADDGQTRAPSSPTEVYWRMLESGASEEEAVAARDRANFELKMKDVTPAEIYWLMLESGASQDEAEAARERSKAGATLNSRPSIRVYT